MSSCSVANRINNNNCQQVTSEEWIRDGKLSRQSDPVTATRSLISLALIGPINTGRNNKNITRNKYWLAQRKLVPRRLLFLYPSFNSTSPNSVYEGLMESLPHNPQTIYRLYCTLYSTSWPKHSFAVDGCLTLDFFPHSCCSPPTYIMKPSILRAHSRLFIWSACFVTKYS